MAVETGRFNNIPIEYRLCTFCHENVLEDEIHFLLFCSAYNDLRNDLLLKTIEIEPGFSFLTIENKLKLLMSPSIVKFTTKFLYNSVQKRRLLEYV